MKKKMLLIISIVCCLVLVGCGKDKKDYRTLTCASQEDAGKVEIKINQNKDSHKLTDGTMSMVVDLTGMGTAATQMDWDAAFCNNGEAEEIPTKSCKTEVKDNSLIVSYELNMDKYADQLKEEAKIEEFNENSLEELKASAEKAGASCSIS